jgi:hypothetical protein
LNSSEDSDLSDGNFFASIKERYDTVWLNLGLQVWPMLEFSWLTLEQSTLNVMRESCNIYSRFSKQWHCFLVD